MTVTVGVAGDGVAGLAAGVVAAGAARFSRMRGVGMALGESVFRRMTGLVSVRGMCLVGSLSQGVQTA